MADAIDISNLALGFIGADANVSAIDPPEKSVEAEKCGQFYPIARDAILNKHPWSFSTYRIAPASMTSETNSWAYAYQIPNDALNILAVLPPDAESDYSATIATGIDYRTAPLLEPAGLTIPVTQPYAKEVLADGTIVVYTNQEDAVLRYAKRVTDTSAFSPLAVVALARLLASYIAGPIVKGNAGVKLAASMLQIFQVEYAAAVAADSDQQKTDMAHTPTHIAARS